MGRVITSFLKTKYNINNDDVKTPCQLDEHYVYIRLFSHARLKTVGRQKEQKIPTS